MWYSFRVGPVLHHVACEVKRLTRPVSRKEMEAFFGKIVDMRERPMALMVSLAGYQSGAKKYAAAKGIALPRLRLGDRSTALVASLLELVPVDPQAAETRPRVRITAAAAPARPSRPRKQTPQLGQRHSPALT